MRIPASSPLLTALFLLAVPAVQAEKAVFLKGINLNGPPLVIEGRQWLGGSAAEAPGMGRIDNQRVVLKPNAAESIARMIRSSVRHAKGENRVVLKGLPEGEFTVFLYVREDNTRTEFDVFVSGVRVAEKVPRGDPGAWKRLGPWVAKATGGELVLTSAGGHSNWSGLEVWKGALVRHPGEEPVPPKPVPAGARYLDQEVAPVLSKHCVECHNPSDKKGKLDLITGEGLEHVVRPGSPKRSEFWAVVKEDEMPKKRPPLAAAEKLILRKWIVDGAEWGSRAVDPFVPADPE